jgi:hypothetical protein
MAPLVSLTQVIVLLQVLVLDDSPPHVTPAAEADDNENFEEAEMIFSQVQLFRFLFCVCHFLARVVPPSALGCD